MAVLVSVFQEPTKLRAVSSLGLYRLSSTRAVTVALLCTLSEIFDVPVYWPILVVYFCVLFALTMRRQIQCVLSLIPGLNLILLRHMIKYKYIPFDIGRKTRYGGSK